MFSTRLKLTHTRCFIPAFFFSNRNVHDNEGTEVIEQKNVGGWQGVVNAFSPDEDGDPSPDVRAIITTVTFSSFMGGIYGSVLYSKRAYADFFEKNQSTLFQNQFQAKAKLQSQVTLAMGRGIFKWGTRVALFCGPYTTIVSIINAYTQNISVSSYAVAGCIVGGFARISMGLKGFVVGSTLGTILGIGVGCLTLLLLKVSPMSMHELKQWQSQNQKERDAFFAKESKESNIFKYDTPTGLLEHDKILQKSEKIINDAT